MKTVVDFIVGQQARTVTLENVLTTVPHMTGVIMEYMSKQIFHAMNLKNVNLRMQLDDIIPTRHKKKYDIWRRSPKFPKEISATVNVCEPNDPPNDGGDWRSVNLGRIPHHITCSAIHANFN